MDARRRLDALTGLRFLAAAAVAVVHIPGFAHDPSLPPTARRFMAEGFAGVPFFFVLSGFVLAYSYHQRLARPARGDLGRFLLARFARIWPVYLLTLAVLAVLPLVPPPTTGWGVGANLLLVQVWTPAPSPYPPGMNPTAWSLSDEVFFYLCLPAFVWTAAKLPGLRRRRLWALAGAAWAAEFGLMYWQCSNVNPWTQYLMVCPLVRLAEFIVGVALGLDYVRSGGDAPAAGRWRWTGLELAALVAVGVAVGYSNRLPLLVRLVGYYTPAFALVVAVFARQRGHLSRLLAGRVPVFLGESSYSFYLTHTIVFTQLDSWLPLAEVGVFAQAGGFLAAALVVSMAVYRLVEVPARNWLVGLGRRAGKRNLRPHRPGRVVPAAKPVEV
ncbi:acyltransferase family protein [Urbifossiella limnaea]|uniref:Acyltransferase family protein n=1 Tax=Urbifossiella limnaea TaxID=2528023 RepID=A0A517XNP0_9BACT|nr:acyltransferase [Urbifossiella limnaea]QDU19119.1 Acyltransferase family protein [Urbifossiella limnaea]